MDETRLRELASSMGMKKTTSADQQELAYYVIDSESENTAKEAVAKNAAKSKIAKEKTPKEKKTRAKRVSKKEPQPDAAPSAESVTENAEIANDTAAATDAPAPKKRGRKPKVKVEEPSETIEVQAEVTVTESDKEGNRQKAPAELVHDTGSCFFHSHGRRKLSESCLIHVHKFFVTIHKILYPVFTFTPLSDPYEPLFKL